MSSIDFSQITELVDGSGYPAMMEAYEARALIYPVLGDIMDPSMLASPEYGTKEAVIEGMERFNKREDGQQIDASTFETAYTWYMKSDQYSRSLIIPSRLRRSVDNLGKIGSMIGSAARGWGEVSRLQKEDFIADIFQKGSLTAGSREFFDGSFPGNADPYPLFIYDGQPFFDTAHVLSANAATPSNHEVTAPLAAATLQAALIAMTNTNAVNERGERVLIRPTHLMVPAALEYTARTILESAQLPGGDLNDSNVVLSAGLQLLVNPALDDSASDAAWWLVTQNRSLKIADSGAPVIMLKEKENGDVIVNAEYLFGAAVANWRYSYLANKAAS